MDFFRSFERFLTFSFQDSLRRIFDFFRSFERFLTFYFQDSLRGRSLSVVEHCGMGEVSTSINSLPLTINITIFTKIKIVIIISIKISSASRYHQHRYYQMESVLRKAQTDQTAILETEVTQSYA